MLREVLTEMGRKDLIGDKENQLIPEEEKKKDFRRNIKKRRK
jgi:hypothetical protein